MQKIMELTAYVIIAAALGFILGLCNRQEQLPPIIIEPGTLIQIKTQDRIIQANPEKLQYYVDELNRYRTEPGWIDVRGNMIHAGLVHREWAARYIIPIRRVYKNTIFVHIGTHWGVAYMRHIGRYSVGIQAGNAGVSGIIGYSF